MQKDHMPLEAPLGSSILQTPECFPTTWSDHDQEVAFHRLSPEMLRSVKFTGDPEFIKTLKPIGRRSIGDLLMAGLIDSKSSVHTHVIFHPAYCCSTLLARYFEQNQRHIVIKEPAVTTAFSLTVRHFSEKSELKLLTIMRLLSRGFPEQDLAVVKFNVFENIIAKDILRIDPTASATFITHGLDACIASILKAPWRVDKVRRWNNNVYRWAYHHKEDVMKPDSLDDIQSVAFWWRYNIKWMTDARAAYPDRTLVVTADEIAEAPRNVLIQTSNLSGMFRIRERITEMLDSGVSREYSKRDGMSYDKEDRKKDIERSLAKFRSEGIRARRWLDENFGGAIDLFPKYLPRKTQLFEASTLSHLRVPIS